ncbi:MAG: MBG domain-containing protein, partial [Eubacteriales bacterium]|nr:MBG domain-containing protein [Eubacteriales bacterium]
MRKLYNKGLAWALTLCMAFGMLPTMALAADTYDGITADGGTADTDYSWNATDKTLTILSGTDLILSGTATGAQILVAGTTEANLTLNGLRIDNTGEDNDAPIKLTDTAKLNLTLADGSVNTLDTHYLNAESSPNIYYARADAIHVPLGTALTIDGTGTLNAKSGRYHAAIGSDAGPCGNITINNGIVNAYAYGTENYPGGVGIGGITNSESTTGTSQITINGGTVTAYGDGVGIGVDDYYGEVSYSIAITDGTVNAYGMPYSDDVNLENASGTYLNSVGIGGHAFGSPNTRSIEISGGTVTAYGSEAGIGGNSADGNEGDSTNPLNIRITGGTVTAKGFHYSKLISIGGNIRSTDQRSIEISGSAQVDATGYYNDGAIGGGDNSCSAITIKGSAVVEGALTIGSTGYDSSTSSGYSGGTIQILENASVGGTGYYDAIGHIGGSDADIYNGTGGAGGYITINTTGTVNATSIGGGTAGNGGAGGYITIQNGTISSTHIGGGDGKNSDGTGIGGDGGNISISGGTIGGSGGNSPTGSINIKSGNGASTRYYAAAGIGGGGGTSVGGDGGTINISGGTVHANAGLTVYDPATGSTATSGTGVGGAGIGGGNGAGGGTLNISGGHVEVSNVDVSPYEATTATAAPALIGGGSAGGAGNITISGGYVKAYVYSQNAPVYGDDATIIGQGKGATDAGGWIKVTGGSLDIPLSTYETTVARPVPWPVAADGSTSLYPATFDFYFAADRPEDLSFTEDDEIVSLALTKKSGGGTYSYNKTGIKPNEKMWLPIEEDVNTWTNSDYHDLYNITVSVKKDNTTYGFTGVVHYQKNEYHVGGIIGACSLTYTGEVIETIQLASDWGTGSKTYDGTDLTPAMTVKNMEGVELTEGVDYTLEIEHTPNDGTGTPVTVTEMKSAGGYIVTATGKTGTDYAGMTATSDEFWINPKNITGIYSGSAFTKEYDGTTDVYDGTTEVESITLTINESDLCTGDALTDIVAQNPRYASSGVGSNIDIDANSPDYTYTMGGQPCNICNYSVDLPAITGDITVKAIGETNLDASGVTVTKVYSGDTSCTLTNVSGSVTLVDLVGEEIATVNITGVSAFDSASVGSRTVTLTIGDLAGTNAANYTLAGGADTITVTASITPADYTYNLTEDQQEQDFTQGGGLSQISVPQTANGVNSETVTGTVTLWHDEACTANQATDTSVNALTVGSHSLYVKFVPDASETNYDTTKITTGEVVVLTVVEGDPQDVSFATTDTMTKTYGDAPFTNAATNASDESNTPTYSSSNTNVATVEGNTGVVTINAAGTATITATVPEVEGQYRETSVSYTLTVGKKPVTVNAADATRKFGEANPTFTLENLSAVLVSGDAEADLAVSLTTTAVQTSNVGGYSITGTSASTNYNVTVTPGTLTVTKADAPILSDISKSLLYSEAHSDVAVIVTALPVDRGTTSFAAGTVTDNDGIINGDVTATATGISLSTNSGAENQTATIPVTVTMQNYTDVSVNVIVTLVDKTPVTITGGTVANKTYDGAAAAYTGTPANEQGYTGTYEYIWSGGSAPKNAGNYTLTVKIPDDNADFMGEVEIQFIISPKSLTVKPKNLSIYNGAALPTAFTLTYEGLVSGDTITPAGTPEFALKNGADALANSSANGTYTIEWTNKADVTVEHANYDITKADGTLTISTQPSYNGGGGSSTPATSTTPAVSGSTATTTVTAQTGTNGTATASVTQSQVTSAIEKAQAAAK